MVISKQLASEIAKHLTESNNVEINTLKKQLSDIVYKEYVKKVPKDVIKGFKENPDYFNVTTQIQLVGNGFNYDYITIAKAPYNYNSNRMTLTGDVGKQAEKLHVEIKKLKEVKTNLFNEIESTLLALKTYKRIETEFKKAAKYLPKKQSGYLPTINCADLEKRIKP